MKKATKVWLILAVCLMIIGCVGFVGVMTALQWDFTNLATTTYETHTYDVTDAYTNISVLSDTADIAFVVTDDDTTRVVCYDEKQWHHTVTVQEDTLIIQPADIKKWYDYIGFDFETSKITVYMPADTYGNLVIRADTSDIEIPKELTFNSVDITGSTGDIHCAASAAEKVKIYVSTGDIDLQNVAAGDVDLTVSTGHVTVSDITCSVVSLTVSTGKADLANVTCDSLQTAGGTGDISLLNVVAKEQFSVVRDTGDVTLEECDAAEIFVETDTGDVRGSLLTEKVFVANSNTGRVTVPETISGGKCKVSTDTGDIYFTIAE